MAAHNCVDLVSLHFYTIIHLILQCSVLFQYTLFKTIFIQSGITKVISKYAKLLPNIVIVIQIKMLYYCSSNCFINIYMYFSYDIINYSAQFLHKMPMSWHIQAKASSDEYTASGRASGRENEVKGFWRK